MSSLESFRNYSPTHAERASVFIGQEMTECDRDSAVNIAEEFYDPDRPTAHTAVMIPVAAHQDGELIAPALQEYAGQKTAEPFTIFMHLNAPVDKFASPAVEKAVENVELAQTSFPNLDIRKNLTYYEEPTIGQIRRDLWNAVFVLAYNEHNYSRDVIGLNHDVDVNRMSPHYIARIQEYYQRRHTIVSRHLGEEVAYRAVHKPVATRLTHTVLPTHPNVGKVTTWVDNTSFQAPGHLGYEAGLVIPFGCYAEGYGFSSKSVTHETSWVYGNDTIPYLPSSHLYTSPRRFIERLHEHNTSAVWTTDSFGSNDSCRDTLRPDIEFDRAESIILDRLYDDIMHYWLPGVMRRGYDKIEAAHYTGEISDRFIADLVDEYTVKVEKQLEKAIRMMRRLVGSATLAELIQGDFDSEDYAERQIKSMHYLYEAVNGDEFKAALVKADN